MREIALCMGTDLRVKAAGGKLDTIPAALLVIPVCFPHLLPPFSCFPLLVSFCARGGCSLVSSVPSATWSSLWMRWERCRLLAHLLWEGCGRLSVEDVGF